MKVLLRNYTGWIFLAACFTITGLALSACSTVQTGAVPAHVYPIIAPTTAVPCINMLNALGADSEVSQGQNAALVITDAVYAGVRILRDYSPSLIPYCQSSGVKLDYVFGGANVDWTNSISNCRILAQSNVLLSLEGPNEPNNWPVTWNGVTSPQGRTGDWAPVVEYQEAIYQEHQTDSMLSNYPVFSVSDPGSMVNDCGLQFLIVPPNAGVDDTQFVGLTNADYCNCHVYIGYGEPYTNPNSGWSNALYWFIKGADETFAGDYCYTWMWNFTGYSTNSTPTYNGWNAENVPKVITEDGTAFSGTSNVTCASGVETPETQQANQLIWTFIDSFKNGYKYIIIYQLVDQGGEMSLFNGSYIPFQSGTNFHNLMTIMADTNVISTPGQMDYYITTNSVTNEPYTVHDMLLQKSNGNFYLFVWDENPAYFDTVTVNFGGTYTNVQLFDPAYGTAPIANLETANSATITLSDHLNIFELPPAPITVQPTPVPQPSMIPVP